MNSYVKDNGNIMGGHAHQYECSSCRYTITTDHRREHLLFCFHCGCKFGPEPRKGPTEGEWYYKNGRVLCHDSSGPRTDVIAEVYGQDGHDHREEQLINGHLMAASKKLLAKLKLLVAVERPTARELAEAREAIAEAEKGKQ